MLNTNFLNKLDDEVLGTIADAQMADLIERRHIQDEDLFKECFRRAFDAEYDPDGTEPRIIVKIVENFTDIAGQAFTEYHAVRDMRRAEAAAQAEADAWEVANAEAETKEADKEATEEIIPNF